MAKIQDSMTELERLVQKSTVGPSLPYIEELMASAVSVAKASQAAESQADPQPFPGKNFSSDIAFQKGRNQRGKEGKNL